jgi:VPDSG-CTERM motif
MKKLKYIAPILIAIACLGLQQVKADMASFDLFSGNPGISGFPGPYAHVVVDRTSQTTATITFTSLTNGGNIYLMGGQGAVAVNVVGSGFASPAATASNSGTGFTPGSVTFAGAGNEDGFGSFNVTYDSFDGYTHSSDTISFTLTSTSGGWADAAHVLFANANNQLAAAHIFVAASPADASAGALATGYAAGNGSSVPDGGATVMLLGAALGALGMARRFLRS